jgi:hypothetical protein
MAYDNGVRSISGFLDFFHRPEFYITGKQKFSKMDVSSLKSGKGETYLAGSLRKS